MKTREPDPPAHPKKKMSASSPGKQRKTGITDRQRGDSIRSEYLDFGVHRIYYEMRGSGRKTLVFLHGWSSGTSSWKYQLVGMNPRALIP